MKNSSLYISLVALVASIAAVIMSLGASKTVAPQQQGMSVEETLNNNPEIIINAMQKYEQKMREQALAEAQKMLTDNIDAINNDPNSPIIGNPNGEITLVEFFDFSCGFCHRLYPALKNIVAKNNDVRLVLRELTFLGPVSDYAAKAALAAKEQGKYQELWSAMMENDGALSEEKIDELAANAGIDVAKMKADMNSAKVLKTIQDTADLANTIEIRGVPTMILDGQILQTLDEAEIQRRIDAMKN